MCGMLLVAFLFKKVKESRHLLKFILMCCTIELGRLCLITLVNVGAIRIFTLHTDQHPWMLQASQAGYILAEQKR